MSDQHTFTGLYKSLSNPKTTPESVIKDAKLFVEIAACIFGGPAAAGVAAIITAISEKGKLFDAATRIIEKIHEKKEGGYSEYTERMNEAYAILCFSAFFDTMTKNLPDDILKGIAITSKEKEAVLPLSFKGQTEHLNRVALPDLLSNFSETDTNLKNLYSFVSERITHFVHQLSFYDNSNETKKRVFDETMKKLPNDALAAFHNQFLTLCEKFPRFYIFVQAQREVAIDERWKEIISLAQRNEVAACEGLSDLKNALYSLPSQIKQEAIYRITSRMRERYQNNLDEPVVKTENAILEDPAIKIEDNEKFVFPPIAQAFVPQQFKLLRYTGKERLEQKDTWANLNSSEDMEAFWAKYLLAQESTEHIVLILGEPGSGKSLLSEVICGQMSREDNLVVRVPLRAYNMEGTLEDIICEQIEKDGDAGNYNVKLKSVAEEFPHNPITIIFDGYDEVQQATGRVYRNFLKNLKTFQKECETEKRPVRIIVTSRCTLIDKADIPRGTLVMKLLDFDGQRKSTWIKTWNRYNHDSLLSAGISDFVLPEGNHEIDELSGQPLLLMMLAIYDADFENGKNALSDTTLILNRTQLYDSLLKRFIRRELIKGKRGKDVKYTDVDDLQKQAIVENEMERLGIAALGMFNRGKLSITAPEVETDFAKLKVKQTQYGQLDASMFKSGEVFFGSFFFIHKPPTKRTDSVGNEEIDEDTQNAAFEFLHKTFYEFLVANYVLNVFLSYAVRLVKTKADDSYYYEDGFQTLGHQLFSRCFSAMSGAVYCVEPEIIQMIAEWKDVILNRYIKNWKIAKEDDVFLILHDLLKNYLVPIRTGSLDNAKILGMSLVDNRSSPQLCSVFFLNLITLQALITGSSVSSCDDWHFISQYIRLYSQPISDHTLPEETDKRRPFVLEPADEILLKFMALFEVRRNEGQIIVYRRKEIVDFRQRSLLDARLELLSFMQDDIGRQVYRLHEPHLSQEGRESTIRSLNDQGMNLQLESALETLHRMQREHRIDLVELIHSIYKGLKVTDYGIMEILLNARQVIIYNSVRFRNTFELNTSKNRFFAWNSSFFEQLDDITHRIIEITEKLAYELNSPEIVFQGRRYNRKDSWKAPITIWLDCLKQLGFSIYISVIHNNLKICKIIDSVQYELATYLVWHFKSSSPQQNSEIAIWPSRLIAEDIIENIDSYMISPIRVASWLLVYRTMPSQIIRNIPHNIYLRREIPIYLNHYFSSLSDFRAMEELPSDYFNGISTLLRECILSGYPNCVKAYVQTDSFLSQLYSPYCTEQDRIAVVRILASIQEYGAIEHILYTELDMIGANRFMDDTILVHTDEYIRSNKKRFSSVSCSWAVIYRAIEALLPVIPSSTFVKSLYYALKVVRISIGDDPLNCCGIIICVANSKLYENKEVKDLLAEIVSDLLPRYKGLVQITSASTVGNLVNIWMQLMQQPFAAGSEINALDIILLCIDEVVLTGGKEESESLIQSFNTIAKVHDNDLYPLYDGLLPRYKAIKETSPSLAARIKQMFPSLN